MQKKKMVYVFDHPQDASSDIRTDTTIVNLWFIDENSKSYRTGKTKISDLAWVNRTRLMLALNQ